MIEKVLAAVVLRCSACGQHWSVAQLEKQRRKCNCGFVQQFTIASVPSSEPETAPEQTSRLR